MPCPHGCGEMVTKRGQGYHAKKCPVLLREVRESKREGRNQRQFVEQDVDFGEQDAFLAGPSHEAVGFTDDDMLLRQPSRSEIAAKAVQERLKSYIPKRTVSVISVADDDRNQRAEGYDTDESFDLPSLGSAVDDSPTMTDLGVHIDEDIELLYPINHGEISDSEADQVESHATSKCANSPDVDSTKTPHVDEEWSKILQRLDPPSKHHPDPFHPDNFDEFKTKEYVHTPLQQPTGMTASNYAQLDLLLILRNAGCPLYLHDVVINWLCYHSKSAQDRTDRLSEETPEGEQVGVEGTTVDESPSEESTSKIIEKCTHKETPSNVADVTTANESQSPSKEKKKKKRRRKNKDTKDSTDWIFHPRNLKSRKSLLSHLSKQFGTKRREPHVVNMKLPSDDRMISFTKFSFVEEFMSMLHDDELMQDCNMVEGYEIETGHSKITREPFWKEDTIKPSEYLTTPVANDPSRPIRHLYDGTKFQKSRARFCNREYHMPVPLILFYDESHLDRTGALTNAPMFMTVGWFNHKCRARIEFWRVIGLVPHLGLGKGKSSSSSAEEKSIDHHALLEELFRELREICSQGGIRTTFRGRRVLLKFWIQFVIGDTKGHNDLCGSKQKSSGCCPMRFCLCGPGDLDQVPLQCQAVTTELLENKRRLSAEERRAVRSGKKTEEEIIREHFDSICYRITDICFNRLPMGHPTRGIMGCTPFECLHVFDVGIIKYITEALYSLMKGRKRDRERFDQLFRAMSRHMERQSETDMARRGTNFEQTDNTRFTGRERIGNLICTLVCLHTFDGDVCFLRSLENKRGMFYKIKETIELILTFERWVLQSDNSAGEVVIAEEMVNYTMTNLRKHLPREEGEGWGIPKYHALGCLFRQILEDGPGEGYTSQHGEGFHRTQTNGAAKLTQMRGGVLVEQMGTRMHENTTMDIAAEMSVDHLSRRARERIKESKTFPERPSSRHTRSYNRVFEIPDEPDNFTPKGKYDLIVPSYDDVHKRKKKWKTTWSDRSRQQMKLGVFHLLLFAISSHAKKHGWTGGFKVTGYTTVVKEDTTTGEMVQYRSDPHFMGRKWQDWGMINFPLDGVCVGQILGFVSFLTRGFPTPMILDKAADDGVKLTDLSTLEDDRLYVVVRCSRTNLAGMGYDRRFIPTFKLQGRNSVYIIPMEWLVGPAMVVPYIQSHGRTKQDEGTWMLIRPMRLWGDWFGNKIRGRAARMTDDNYPERDEEEIIDASEDGDDEEGVDNSEAGNESSSNDQRGYDTREEDDESEDDMSTTDEKSTRTQRGSGLKGEETTIPERISKRGRAKKAEDSTSQCPSKKGNSVSRSSHGNSDGTSSPQRKKRSTRK